MKIKYIITIIFHVAILAVFDGMLSIASTPFQIVVISGIALIYASISGTTIMLSTAQISIAHSSQKRFIYMLKLRDDPLLQDDIDDFEEISREDGESVNVIMILSFIKGFFLTILSLGAFVSIYNAVDSFHYLNIFLNS